MKILLTGAGGQLGKTFYDIANEQQRNVIPLTKDDLDISDVIAVEKQLKEINPAVVINAAAYTLVDKAENEKQKAAAVNITGAKSLAIVCKQMNVPLIHISTDYVFDGSLLRAYAETDKPSPVNYYGESKFLGEEAVRQIYDKHIILRVSWVFGSYGNNFVKTICRLAKNKSELRIVNDQFGCPTATDNISLVILQIVDGIINENFSEYGTYHYCDKPQSNWYEFTVAIVEELKKHQSLQVENIIPITTNEYPTPAPRPKSSVLNCKKIETVFSIKQYEWLPVLENLVKDFSEK